MGPLQAFKFSWSFLGRIVTFHFSRDERFHYLESENSKEDDVGVDISKPYMFARTAGYDLIQRERSRQVEEEGRTAEMDSCHTKGELFWAAKTYEIITNENHDEVVASGSWPWDMKWFKPKDRKSNLIRAGALVEAEIDRFDALTEKVQISDPYRKQLICALSRITKKLNIALSAENRTVEALKTDEE